MSFAGCQINLIDVNFHLQKSFEIFDKKWADKIWPQNHKEIKVSPLMPIRVKMQLQNIVGSNVELLLIRVESKTIVIFHVFIHMCIAILFQLLFSYSVTFNRSRMWWRYKIPIWTSLSLLLATFSVARVNFSFVISFQAFHP